jgi:hypothetical protein
MNMDKTQARLFRQRWQAVQMIQQEQARESTLEQHWRQLNAAFGLGKGLHLVTDDSDEMRVYLRWAKLKENQLQHPKV